MPITRLSDLLGQRLWPATFPQTLAALVSADPEDVSGELAWALRHQAVDATHRQNSVHHVNGPTDVLDLITRGYVLHPWAGAWKTYALGTDRAPMLRPSDTGRVSYVVKATRLIPKVDDLPPLPPGTGSSLPLWLPIYGGSPDVLAKPGVAKGLATLARRVAVADVVFYHADAESGTAPTLWSVRAGAGISGASRAFSQQVDFPNFDGDDPVGLIKEAL